MMSSLWIEIIGWSGAALILADYALLSIGRLQPDSSVYHGVNVVGALCFIINSGWNGAWPSVGSNIVWALIGLTALVRLTRTEVG